MYSVWDFNIVPRMQGSPGGELGFPAKVAPDGSIWFIEEMADKIGRVNPKTGEFKEYSVAEDKNASSHGVVVDRCSSA